MNTYVVRVYRSEENQPHLLVGVVEEVGVEGKKAFNSFDELWAILNPGHKEANKLKTGTGDGGKGLQN
jgi:hypothetical protein